MAASSSLSSVTSSAIASMLAAAVSALSAGLSMMITCAPSCAMIAAPASPMPDPAEVRQAPGIEVVGCFHDVAAEARDARPYDHADQRHGEEAVRCNDRAVAEAKLWRRCPRPRRPQHRIESGEKLDERHQRGD